MTPPLPFSPSSLPSPPHTLTQGPCDVNERQISQRWCCARTQGKDERGSRVSASADEEKLRVKDGRSKWEDDWRRLQKKNKKCNNKKNTPKQHKHMHSVCE